MNIQNISQTTEPFKSKSNSNLSKKTSFPLLAELFVKAQEDLAAQGLGCNISICCRIKKPLAQPENKPAKDNKNSHSLPRSKSGLQNHKSLNTSIMSSSSRGTSPSVAQIYKHVGSVNHFGNMNQTIPMRANVTNTFG